MIVLTKLMIEDVTVAFGADITFVLGLRLFGSSLVANIHTDTPLKELRSLKKKKNKKKRQKHR